MLRDISLLKSEEKYKLLAAGQDSFQLVVDLIKKNIEELKDKNNNKTTIDNIFTKHEIITILLANPDFPDDKKLELMKTIKQNEALLKGKYIMDFKDAAVFLAIQDEYQKDVYPYELKASVIKKFNLISSQKNNVIDDKTKDLIYVFEKLEAIFKYKKYSGDNYNEKIDEVIATMIEIIDLFAKESIEFAKMVIDKKSIFGFLSKDWFGKMDESYKLKIKDYTLSILETINNIQSPYTKGMYKETLGHLYTHIKIDKISSLNFVFSPSYYIDSVNMMENEKYRNKVMKNINIKNIRNPSFLNEYKYLSEYFQEDHNSGYFMYNFRDKLINSKRDILSVINPNEPLLKNRTKDLDFIFKRKDFDLEFFKYQIANIISEYQNVKADGNKKQEENFLLLQYSKFLSFSWQNIYLMEDMFKKDKNLFEKIAELYKGIQDVPVRNINMAADRHMFYAQFNVENFLEMEQNFKEEYLKESIKIMQVINCDSFYYFNNFVKIFQKEPELGKLFEDVRVIDSAVNDIDKSYEIYLKEIDNYSKTLLSLGIDKEKVVEIKEELITQVKEIVFPTMRF